MAHQSKRPYAGSIHQPQITSFFPSSPVPSTSSPSTEPRTPPLPHHTQSNLLSVGMRVRKSVPEGYKTGSYSAFTLFSDASPPSSPEEGIGGGNRVGERVVRNRPRARELTPFCGILKVGGMAQQQWGIYNPSRGTEDMDEDEEECPVLSQGSDSSVESAFGGYAGGNKRRFDEEDEEGEMSVRLGMRFGNAFGGGRVMAVPRRKKMSVGGAEGKGMGIGMGQENMNVRVQVEGDFEEAEFLDYGSMGEVEMGGV